MPNPALISPGRPADPRVTSHVDKIRREVSPTLELERRSQLGQFMTPETIAAQMARLFDDLPGEIRLLDAGAGVGALTAAFIAELLTTRDLPTSVSVTAFEIDPDLAKHLKNTLDLCRHECEAKGVAFSAKILECDYILWSASDGTNRSSLFNCAILNPPYKKLSTSSDWRLALRSQGIETVNLYSAFVALALNQLQDGGQLVAITPRSFCNGPYYEPFRKHLLRSAGLVSLYVFVSRKEAFKDDAVLQENLIFHLRKGEYQPKTVRIANDEGAERQVSFSDVVRPGDVHQFFRLTLSEADAALAERVQSLPCKLSDLGIKVSTGRVVDFRAREHLRKDPGQDTVPLIYPAHLRDASVSWPIDEFKKYNALQRCEQTEKLLVPAGCYVLTKRFSSKEEKRRLVASVYNPETVAGIENHLNYFHASGKGLPLVLATGLAAFLNSTAADDYFRQFSGHTQVNATDLRNLHFPEKVKLEKLGRLAPIGQSAIDEAVEYLL